MVRLFLITTSILLFSTFGAKSQDNLKRVMIDGAMYYILPDSTPYLNDSLAIAEVMDTTTLRYVTFYNDSTPSLFINRKKVKGGTGITTVYPNGNIKEIYGIKNGQLAYSYYYYSENGYIQMMGQYKKGVKHAKWIIFHVKDGALARYVWYKKGEMRKTKEIVTDNKLYNKAIIPSERRDYNIEYK